MKKKTIVLSLVPFFALMACSDNNPSDRVVMPKHGADVSVNADGSYSQTTEQKVDDANKDLNDSYREAQAGGYKGSIEDWAKITALYESDPELALNQAKDNGFSQSDIIFATLAGVAISALVAKSMINNADATTRAYQQQRLNNQTKYAYSQPYDHKAELKKQDRDRRGGVVAGSGGGYSASTASRNAQSVGSSGYKGSGGYTSVSRGGFGGAVGVGG